jgi:FtsP/CotA-like multicopper oxidase with cupredoxin domain
MGTQRFALGVRLMVAATLLWGVGQAGAQMSAPSSKENDAAFPAASKPKSKDTFLQSKQEEARKRNIAAWQARIATDPTGTTARAARYLIEGPMQAPAAAGGFNAVPPVLGFNPAVNYTIPNFAYSPNLRKFVDSLPGLGAANANNLGQYVPIAVPDTATYPGSDYYVIAVKQYTLKMHSDLPPTTLRGYTQLNTVDPTVLNINQYLGPAILAKTHDPTKPLGGANGKPVRVLFQNLLPTGAAGNLFLPVDTTIMGAGAGPIAGQNYTHNRVTIPHLHGGNTPWISDGTPHQWMVPAGEVTPYQKGASFVNVPDMVGPGKSIPAPAPGDGMGTLFWTNQQSNRLMFYHDHAYGTTRLNVYGGMAAAYVLTDQAEEDIISGTNGAGGNPGLVKSLPDLGGVYHYGIPLVVQDRTFVNDATTPPGPGFAGTPTPPTLSVDPLWATYVGTGGGNLWMPHEYMPNEDIYNPLGYNVMGRWDYGPFINPALIPVNLTLPSPTIVPEAFGDTMIVNGCAFPYVTLPPTAVRFRILNACNDRFLNLQFYLADPANPTEVKMVPAVPNDAYPTWPRDGRDGGVPDPTTQGPTIYQIGNEGGFLPQVAVIPPQPVDFDYNRRSVTFGGMMAYSLLLLPAERADVVVDFSAYAPGTTLILYNDAPAPAPLFDSRYDNYTGSPDQTAIGGAPATSVGFGPNTRTIMQIRIAGTATPPFDVGALQAALPAAYKVSQAPPVVPESAYNAAFGTAYGDTYANNASESLNLTGLPQPVNTVVTVLPGSGYTTPPTVNFVGGGGTGAIATAALNGVTAVTVTATGTGYTSPPTVALTGGGGTGATAVASVTGGGVSAIVVTNPGSGYTTNPVVTITGGGGTGATATAGITLGGVGQITLTSGGSGYTYAPKIFLTGGGGTGATADCMLAGSLPIGIKNITEGMDITYGRMNVQLGTTPVPLDPLAPAPQVPGIAMYIDPPSDFWYDGKTYLFRIAHLGVDSHAVHFHLANLQVVNRVDYTNTNLPPDANELGWKETIKSVPFTDLILAVRPQSQILPFAIPNSSRLMDVTTPVGSTLNYVQPAVVPGLPNPAGISNKVTDYGWEYVWHCHLLGHEENDMMRPLVLVVSPPAGPTGLAAVGSVGNAPLSVTLSWTRNSYNESGFTVQRATNSSFTQNLKSFIAPPQSTGYVDSDPALVGLVRYYYRVNCFNGAGASPWSNSVNLRLAVGPVPAAPGNLTTGTITRNSVVLNWTLPVGGGLPTGFVIQRATDAAFTTGVVTATVNTPTLVTYTRGGLNPNTPYWFRVAARNAAGTGPYSNVVTATTLP